ncbi:PPE domain-containing protein [Streptomyces iconiensis]|uniref:PPE domain-containing protein n=1 Tax=Streptomyces iconiensis TaxID=1384038 RepID=A0ABT6ZY79_9ACTN|nr:PPE domain-containing protein [Streptomyces iconiensis]MDJ1134029.1 PPE domain-containing protein [Streptomyces iconiensis]
MDTPQLSYTSVRDVNLEPLRQAVSAWGKLPGKIDAVSTTFSRTVSTPLEGSGWFGETAESAFKRFRGIRQQMSEASGQAEKIGTTMSEALKAFESAQRALKDVEDALKDPPKGGDGKRYLKVNQAEGVVYLDPPDDVENSPALQKAFHESIVTYNKRISEALDAASNADHDLKTALQIDPPGKGFNDDIAGHLKDVDAETKKDVDALMKLANTEGFKENPKLLSQFNGILAKNSQNADFAEQFALRKGAKGVLDFWYQTAKPGYEDGPLGEPKKRPAGVTKQLAALQDNLGVTLALASQSDSPEMTQWKKDAIDLGYKRLPGEHRTYFADPPYGFQVMSNLMRTGKWDTKFLDTYGDKLVEVDKKSFTGPGGRVEDDQTHRKWLAYGQQPADFLNFGPKWDEGEDPFTGYFEALGHNSDASTGFFKDDENFDHVMRERTWLPDGEVPDSGSQKDFNGPRVALGHALGSATTGHDWDAPLNVPAEHTKDQADLMSKIVKGTGSMDDEGNANISLAPGMREGLGNAAAEYTPDFFRAMTDGEGDDKLFPMSGEQAGMEHREATRFLVQLGQDPDANAAITAGQKLYTAQVLDHHLGGDVPEGQRYDAPPRDIVHEVLKTSGEMSGTLASGAQEGIIGPAVLEEKDYDKATLSNRLWGNTAFGSVVTGISVAEPVVSAHPVGAAVTAALVVGASGAMSNDVDAEHWDINKSAPAAEKASVVYDEMAARDVVQNQRVLKAIGEEHGVDVSSSWARLYSAEGFSQGYSRVGSTAPFLTSIEQVKQMAIEK